MPEQGRGQEKARPEVLRGTSPAGAREPCRVGCERRPVLRAQEGVSSAGAEGMHLLMGLGGGCKVC